MADATASKSQSDIWWVFLLEGIASVLFGFLLITRPAETLVALVLFLGFYWLFIGVLELVRVFVDKSVPWYWSLLIGVLGVLAGIIVLKHPVLSAVVLPAAIVLWLGVLGVVIGIVAIIGAFTGGGVGSFIFGLVNLIIGVILLGAPIPAALAVPIVFGVLLLVQGVILIFYAFKVRE
ncbi:MAG: HdeD family acid-resistance protein [Pseudomonadota bacterium]